MLLREYIESVSDFIHLALSAEIPNCCVKLTATYPNEVLFLYASGVFYTFFAKKTTFKDITLCLVENSREYYFVCKVTGTSFMMCLRHAYYSKNHLIPTHPHFLQKGSLLYCVKKMFCKRLPCL